MADEIAGGIEVLVTCSVKVTKAPDTARITLGAMAGALAFNTQHGFWASEGCVYFGTGEDRVTYEVTGWDNEAKALVLRKVT